MPGWGSDGGRIERVSPVYLRTASGIVKAGLGWLAHSATQPPILVYRAAGQQVGENLGLRLTPGTTKIKATWDARTDVAAWTMFLQDSEGLPISTVASGDTNLTMHEWMGLTPSTDYTMILAATLNDNRHLEDMLSTRTKALIEAYRAASSVVVEVASQAPMASKYRAGSSVAVEVLSQPPREAKYRAASSVVVEVASQAPSEAKYRAASSVVVEVAAQGPSEAKYKAASSVVVEIKLDVREKLERVTGLTAVRRADNGDDE